MTYQSGNLLYDRMQWIHRCEHEFRKQATCYSPKHAIEPVKEEPEGAREVDEDATKDVR